jgi:hypothetical protein
MNCPICGKPRTFWGWFTYGIAHPECKRAALGAAPAKPGKAEARKAALGAILAFIGFVALVFSEHPGISLWNVLSFIVLVVGFLVWISGQP